MTDDHFESNNTKIGLRFLADWGVEMEKIALVRLFLLINDYIMCPHWPIKYKPSELFTTKKEKKNL